MAKLAPISWRQFDKFLVYVGCEFVRVKGSHRIYHRVGLNRPIVVPAYPDIPIFIIRNNIRLLNIPVEEYLKILDSM